MNQQQLQLQIQQLASQGQWQAAFTLSQQLTQAHPEQAQAWMMQSTLAFHTGQADAVVNAINAARRLEPDNLSFQLHQVMALEAIGQVQSAIDCAQQMAEQPFQDLTYLEPLAAFLNKHQLLISADRLYQQAIKIQPNNGQLWLNAAMVKQYLGDMQQAEALVTQALQINPHDPDAHFFRSHLTKQDAENNHIKALQNTSQQAIDDPTARAKVYFALAKEWEDCQQYANSFKARAQGAGIYRRSLNYDLSSDLSFMQALGQAYHQKLLQQPGAGHESKSPIFIVGLPRSGTTLLERIIGSHTDVTSAGELTQFNRCMLAGMQQMNLSPQLSRAQMVAASVNLNFQNLGQNYLNSVPPQFRKTPHFIDKFPQNAQYLGLIHKALPQAKILILERHPLDVCYAVYKQMFTDIYQFSYDLNELAEYFIAHHKLMRHWQRCLPEAIQTVRYEDLVHELSQTAQQVIGFCGLKWQDQCLEFHKNQQASTTASASQVRQKIYSSSVGMWKNYQSELAPLIEKLTAAGCLDDWVDG